MKHGSIRAGSDDGVVRDGVRTVTKEFGLDLDLQRPFGDAWRNERNDGCKSGTRCVGRQTHASQFESVFASAHAIQSRPQLTRNGGIKRRVRDRRTELRNSATATLFQPWSELRHGRPGLGADIAAPQLFIRTNDRQELSPSFLWVIGENGARALAIGEVEVLAVSQEWVDTIGATRDRNWIAGTDEDNRTELIPLCFDGAPPALDGLCNRVVGLFSRHTFAHLTRVTSKPRKGRG